MRLPNLLFLLLVATITATASADAADPLPLATGAQIRQAVSGHTVEGSMHGTGRYTEFYAADGSVRAKGYRARWSVEGDTMCWVYEGQPKDCWQVSLKGDQIKWIKGGKVLGSGTRVRGNPDHF
jgi:hypothetical protein